MYIMKSSLVRMAFSLVWDRWTLIFFYLCYWYREIIPDSRKSFPDIGNSNFRYREICSYFLNQELDFPISENNSRYQEMKPFFRCREMISRYREMIYRYQEINKITAIGKWFPDISGVNLPHVAFTIMSWLQSFRPGLSRSAQSPCAPMQCTLYFRHLMSSIQLYRRHEILEINE